MVACLVAGRTCRGVSGQGAADPRGVVTGQHVVPDLISAALPSAGVRHRGAGEHGNLCLSFPAGSIPEVAMTWGGA